MVQRKVANKKELGSRATNTHNTEKRQASTKPSFQNHDTKSKGADLKAIKMKKSWSIKRSDSEASLRLSSKSHEAPRQPGKPPPIVTPNPKKPSPCKSSYSSPNYMKSTSSSEARKEKTTKVSSVLSTSKLQKVAKTSSLKKIRTLTKAPSFKHTRTSTCSSTLKDSKFPPYLELESGATEAQGNSVLRVCSYNYCSLNGHHHNSAPPLKRFICSRRRQLKSQKVNRPEVLSPRKRKPSECNKTGRGKDLNENFFIKIFVHDNQVATQVSESLSDGPCSEIDFQDDLDQNENSNLSEMNSISEGGGYTPSSVQNQPSFESDLELESSPSVSSGEFFYDNSDIEWEEGQIYATNDNVEILTKSHYSDDQGKPGFEKENSVGGYLEDFHQYPPYIQDEIVEFLCFSDAETLADSESTQTGKEVTEGQIMYEEKDEMHSALNNEVVEENTTPEDEATIYTAKLEDESIVKQGKKFSYHIKEVAEAQNEDLDSHPVPFESEGDESDEVITREITEIYAAEIYMEEREPMQEAIKDIPQICENAETFGKKGETCKADNDDQNDSSEVKLHSHEDNVVEENVSEMEENNSTEEADALPANRNKMQEPRKCNSNDGQSNSNQELLESCNKLKTVRRCRKEDEDVEEEREFNPRGPNFLDIEPDPEAEKVDLKHQEMDDRRNAEEWMLDYALRKTVNQLAPARKKKVALLVEAFEAILPVPKYESCTNRNSSDLGHLRSIQTCSYICL